MAGYRGTNHSFTLTFSAATLFHGRYMGFQQSLEKFQNIIHRWPGKKRFGPYRFLPIFFFSGAAVEFCMIHWRPNGINFCKLIKPDDSYKEKKSREKALQKLKRWKEIEAFMK